MAGDKAYQAELQHVQRLNQESIGNQVRPDRSGNNQEPRKVGARSRVAEGMPVTYSKESELFVSNRWPQKGHIYTLGRCAL